MRYLIPINIRSPEGLPIINAEATIFRHNTTTKAAIFANETGTTQLGNPLPSSRHGRLQGWIESGRYDVRITAPGYKTYFDTFEVGLIGEPIYIQTTEPTITGPFTWWDTSIPDSLSLWVDDGVPLTSGEEPPDTTLRNAFATLATEPTVIAIRDRLPTALDGGRLAVRTDGVVTIANPLDISGLAREITLAAINAKLPTLISGRIPVDIGSTPLTDAQLRAAAVTISAASLPLPTGAATEATLAGIAKETTLNALSGKVGIPSSDDLLSLLREIRTNTGTEITRTDELHLTAEQVNLNTDQVEEKLDTVATRIGTTGVAGSLTERVDAVRALLAAETGLTKDITFRDGSARFRLLDDSGVPFATDNRLPVDVAANLAVTASFDSRVSVLNTTTTPLAANEQFVGEWEEVVDYASVTASIVTDAPSTNKGARAQFSDDGVTVVSERSATIYGGIPGYFSFQPEARYFRITYQNGPTPQTTLNAQIILRFNPLTPVAPVGAYTDDLSLTQSVKSMQQARIMSGPSAGMYAPIGTDGTGNLLVRDINVASQLVAAETARNADADLLQARADLLATDSKLEQVRALLEANEAARDSDASTLQTRVDLLASETKLEQVRSAIASAETARDADATIAQARFDLLATETKLEQVRSVLESILNRPHPDVLTDTQLRATPVPVSGTVGLDTASLAALETINVDFTGEGTLASETTLASILTKLPSDPATGARQTTLSNLITEVRDRQQRTEERDIAYWASVIGGRLAFNITTGIITISGTGEHELAALVNPAGSGKDIYLDLGEFGASANTTFRRYRNATITPTASGNAGVNTGGGTATSVARMYPNGTYTRGTGAGAGTVAKTAHIAAFQQYVTELKGRSVLRPGNVLAWTIQGSSALGSSLTCSIFFEYWERDAA